MPEGDTIHRAAKQLRESLVQRKIVGLGGSHRAVAPHRSRLTGRRITHVEAHGKHILIHVERGWSIRSHMAMTGHWRVYGVDEPWDTTPGKARVVVETEDAVAVCFAAPYVEIGPTDRVMAGLARIGPDLIGDDVSYDDIVERAMRHSGPTMADLLLDQSVASGIGNVFKSEVLFLEHVDPQDPPAALSATQLERLYRTAARLLVANVGPRSRTTTGSRRRGEEHWVYGRGGRPCRRCGGTIETDRHGDLNRSTYWCPACQPSDASGPPSSRRASNG